MGGKNKRGKTRLDAYYRLAKDQGYRARSAFKLIQLNRKYDFLAKSRVAVDLCAAPGGWCQVCAKFMPVGSKIIGVDLDPIAPIRGVKTFVGDITDDKTKKTIQVWLKKEPVDVVIHDGAPNVGGAWARDLFQQNALVLCSLKLATQLLKPDGWFVSKVFRSPDYQKLIWVLKQFFTKVEATKPLASRMESAEIFVVCAGFRAPKTVDPKMFSAQHVFSEVKPEKILNQAGQFVVPKSNVPEGYDEFNTITHRVATLNDFLTCENPKDFLKHYQEIRFNQETDKQLLDSKHSKKELVYLCHDLQQVGEADRRRLVRWREQLLREQSRLRLAQQQREGAFAAEAEPDAEVELGDEDDMIGSDGEEIEEEDDATKIATELLAMRKQQAKEIKRKQKKVVDRKLKQVRGLINYDPHESSNTALQEDELMAGEDDFQDDDEGEDISSSDDENFSIADDPKTWALGQLAKVDEKQMAKMFDKHYVEPDSKLNIALDGKMTVDVDDEEEIRQGGDEYQERMQLEEGNEEAADVDKHGNYIPATKPESLQMYRDPADMSDSENEDEEDDGLTPAERKKREKELRKQEKLDEAGAQAKWKRHHMNIDQILNETFPKPKDGTGGKKGKRARAGQEDLVEMGNGSDDDSDAPPTKRSRKEMINSGRLRDESSDSDTDYESLPSEDFDDEDSDAGKQDYSTSFEKLTAQELTKARRKEVKKKNKEARKEKTRTGAQKGKGKGTKNDTGFQEIPMAMTDPEVRARTLAMATSMLDKNKRREMIEGGLNRYTYDDDDDLPDWFLKDEETHNKIELPVAAHEIDFQRRRFMEMNARPSKKVMEAMGRKHKKAKRMLRQAIEKGKTDPRAREKAAGLTVRKMMRTTAIKGQPKQRKGKVKFDGVSKGQHKREKQRVKRMDKQKGKNRGGQRH